MLQVTEYNISLKLGLQKQHGYLITTERAWASPIRAKRSFSPLPEIGTKNQKFLPNLKSGAQFRLNRFSSCIGSLFAGMKSTVHKNQVHCLGAVQWCVCSSLMSAALPVCRGKLRNLRADCSTTEWTLIAWQWHYNESSRVHFKLR